MASYYLMRHCASVPGDRNDSGRALTETGRKQALDMASWLAQQIGRVDTVICSPFMRSIETAEIMAAALGSHIQRTPLVEPDAKPDEAWRQIEHMAGYYTDVLVVTHHPLIGRLVDEISGVSGLSHTFEHGAIALIDTYAKQMHWLINPELVARDEELEDAAAELAESAAALAEAGQFDDDEEDEDELPLHEVDAPIRGGLKHAKHANKLAPIRADATAALRKFFKRQGSLLLSQIKPKLREADVPDPKKKAAQIIPSNLPIAITGGTSVDYSKALEDAIGAGYKGLSGELGADKTLSEDIVQRYLTDHSLTKLTGDFEETTVERLRNALSDAYANGADFEGLVQAVKDEYAGFNDVRAGMIAQTEMNAAYNAGRKQIGLDLGFNEKSWDPDGTACEEICAPNTLDGWIDMDGEFSSGDDEPPAHPNCDCSLNVRYNADADAEE